jgi:hypothetical protein
MPLSVPSSDSRAPPNSDTIHQNNDNANNSTTTTSPFRNSSSTTTTTDGVATTILENTKLTLPPPSDGIKERIVTFPNNGAIQINPSDGGSITYTPNINFVGTDTFTIQQCPSNKNNEAIERNDDATCQSFTVIVQVQTSVDKESSSSSNGYYGLIALVVLLPLLIGYGIYRKQKDARTGSSATNYSATSTTGSKNNDVSSATVPVAAEPRGSDIADPNTNLTLSSNVLPAAIGMVEPQAQLIHDDFHAVAAAYHYSVTQKDQCRPVIPPPTAIANAVAVVIPYAAAHDAVPKPNLNAKSLCEL